MPMPDTPLVELREPWLSHVHMPKLRAVLSDVTGARTPVRALRLVDCPRVSDAALAALITAPASDPPAAPGRALPAAPPPTHAFISSLRWLRMSNCHAGDVTVRTLAAAMLCGHLDSLIGLAHLQRPVSHLGRS